MQNIALRLLLCITTIYTQGQTKNYKAYHQEVTRCEQLIADNRISEARQSLDALFNEFDFVFLREYQLATELSVYKQDYTSAFKFLRSGVLGGWSMKNIKKSKRLKPLQSDPRWRNLENEYDSLRKVYVSNLNTPLRKEARELLKKDQKIVFKVFLRIGEKNKSKYALKKFAPYSEKTLARIDEILIQYGYPGEKLIGNSWWTAVNLGHHNGLSREYLLKDTLYLNLRPALLASVERGELHPKEFAAIDDWRHAVIHHHGKSRYGFLGKIPDDSELTFVNDNRENLGLRSIELRNKLLDIEKETGLNLYLPKDWQKGKINVENK